MFNLTAHLHLFPKSFVSEFLIFSLLNFSKVTHVTIYCKCLMDTIKSFIFSLEGENLDI